MKKVGKDAAFVAWTTENEKGFITNLGRFSLRGADHSRAYLLKRYREAIGKRTHWVKMNKVAVLDHLAAAERSVAG